LKRKPTIEFFRVSGLSPKANVQSHAFNDMKQVLQTSLYPTMAASGTRTIGANHPISGGAVAIQHEYCQPSMWV
jgi:hypothetical protein